MRVRGFDCDEPWVHLALRMVYRRLKATILKNLRFKSHFVNENRSDKEKMRVRGFEPRHRAWKALVIAPRPHPHGEAQY